MNKRYIIAGSTFFAFIFIVSAIFVPQIGIGEDQARSTTESILVESAHNYPNNADEWYQISRPGALWMKIYFYKIQLERNYDYLYIYNGAGQLVHSVTSNFYRAWTAQLDGDICYLNLVSDGSTTKYGFRATNLEYEMGTTPPPEDTTPPVVTITAPSNGATVSGTTTISVTATDNEDPSPAMELKIDDGAWFSTAGTYNWDTTAYANEAITLYTRAVDESDNWGYDDITVTVDNYVPPVDTTPPVVTITAPTDGATVSDTINVLVTATDNADPSPTVELKIGDGAWFGTDGSYSLDTTAYTNGVYAIYTRAVDESDNWGYDDISITIDNEAPPPVDGDEHFLGSVAGAEVDYYEIFAYEGEISVSVSWVGSYDIDCYISTTASYTSYLARGYTTSNPEVCAYTVPTGTSGTFYIGVRMYTSSAPSVAYDCHVVWNAEYVEPPPPPPPPTGDRWAVIAGVSDYKAISDLSYCDEDASDWYNYLLGLGYGAANMRVLGDTHTSNYPAYYAVATEYNTKAALDWLATVADAGHVTNFITSGHGSGDGKGMALLCSWDCNSGENGEDGSFYDTELDDYIGAIAATGAWVHIFIDHCYSGGMGPELMALTDAQNVYCSTTCTDDGYGWDDSAHYNGMWTYWFLEAGLIGQFGSSASTTMEQAFTWAHSVYPKSGGDEPQEFDGSPSIGFLL